jgi:K(+)-stimulated pyrophosphate-energized sodium pump
MLTYFWLAPVGSLLALVVAFAFYKGMMRQSEGTAKMASIAGAVRRGAMAYLRQQYKVVGLCFIGLTGVFSVLAYVLHVQNPWVPFAFITGGFFSALSGYFGMRAATFASSRTANAAMHSLDSGLRLAFRSGAVMGLVVVGLALLDISVWFLILNHFYPHSAGPQSLIVITTTTLTFGMGASTQALFARVGGGIFTKAADVGADLVGKVESGIPEDDPRNPATIADNVGDNVGDVAGMGADLYESYCGAVLATAALGATAFSATNFQMNAVIAPMVIAGLGTVLSVIGMFLVRIKEGASQKALIGALWRGINASSVLIVALSIVMLKLLQIPNAWGVWGSVVTGLVTGIVIGKATEYYTSHGYAPTQAISAHANTGPATVVISGIGTGMISTAIPVLAVSIGTVLAFLFASGFSFDNVPMGLYGIGIAAVGMLSTLGITLATDAYGPIADNAGGNAQMSGLDPEVRRRTDALDALGNTTAATGKGFAIGSAALTALALLASYMEEVRIHLGGIVDHIPTIAQGIEVSVSHASLRDLMAYYDINLLNPLVLVGSFLGSVMAFVFCGLAMQAVGRAAGRMVEEVRRQFAADPGIMAGTSEPDYASCVAISTRGAQREMILPASLAILVPVSTGLILGVGGVMGLLLGGTSTGFVLAIFLANSGGAWDNAKKYIEEGHHGGKGSDAHKAAIIGDTVGDPFKDTSGPSLNILIKLMSMVSIVVSGVTVAYHIL